ncbi:MAG: hypothetical protein IPG33_13155 [Betaproteobacteria bacterium]|nr:hypothetical protein [Betaproteobacteria bacterium]
MPAQLIPRRDDAPAQVGQLARPRRLAEQGGQVDQQSPRVFLQAFPGDGALARHHH